MINLSAKKVCEICPHHCQLSEGEIGKCRGRFNDGEKITALNYGAVTSIALDPIEKKPLYKFFPGSQILSLGSYGCNLNCIFDSLQISAEKVINFLTETF